MSLLRIDASIQGDRSASSALVDVVTDEFLSAQPDATVVRRHLGQEPLPAEAWAAAVAGSHTPEDQRTQSQQDALALAAQIATELQDSSAAVFAFPLYNYGVSQHVKNWIDLAIVGAPAGTRLLEGKPVVLVTTRGGAYGPGTPRHGWDHATDYLRRILVDIWGADLTVIEREFTLVGVVPALDEFTETAALMHKTAIEEATAAVARLAA